MKTRHGFVSNSSSSSFVFAYDENAELKMDNGSSSFTMDDFREVIDRMNRDWSSDSTCIVADGKENVLDYEKEHLSGYDEDEDRKYMDSLESFIDSHDGMDVSTIRISYHDKLARKMYDAFKASGMIVEFKEQEE